MTNKLNKWHASHNIQDEVDVQSNLTYTLCHFIFLFSKYHCTHFAQDPCHSMRNICWSLLLCHCFKPYSVCSLMWWFYPVYFCGFLPPGSVNSFCLKFACLGSYWHLTLPSRVFFFFYAEILYSVLNKMHLGPDLDRSPPIDYHCWVGYYQWYALWYSLR